MQKPAYRITRHLRKGRDRKLFFIIHVHVFNYAVNIFHVSALLRMLASVYAVGYKRQKIKQSPEDNLTLVCTSVSAHQYAKLIGSRRACIALINSGS